MLSVLILYFLYETSYPNNETMQLDFDHWWLRNPISLPFFFKYLYKFQVFPFPYIVEQNDPSYSVIKETESKYLSNAFINLRFLNIRKIAANCFISTYLDFSDVFSYCYNLSHLELNSHRLIFLLENSCFLKSINTSNFSLLF